MELYKRLTLIVENGRIQKVFYPIFPPDKNADDVLAWLRQNAQLDQTTPLQLTLRTNWKDPAAWGLTLVDVARHAANAYEKEGRDRDVTLKRIREAFDAEWFNPTNTPKNITQAS